MSRLLQRLLTTGLGRLCRNRELYFPGSQAPLADPRCWALLLAELQANPWVVYAKPPLGGHRVAIANRRLLAMDDQSLTFPWKDYRQPERSKRMQ